VTMEHTARVPRRHFIAVIGAAAAGTVLAACGQPAPAPTAAPAAKPTEAPKAAAEPTKPAAQPTAAPAAAKPTEAPKTTAEPTKPAAQPTAAPAAAGAKKVITFWQEANTPTAQQGWDAHVAAFNKAKPEIEIKRVFQSEMNNIIKVALASDTGPDCFQRDIPPSYHQPLVDAKLVIAMDDYYKSLPNLAKVFPWAKKRATIAGKVWGVPHEVEFIPIYYNKAVLEKAGIKEIPTKSYDDFLGVCKALKDKGIQALALAGRARTQPGHIFSVLAMTTIGKEGFEDILYGEGKWDQAGIVDAATNLKNLLDMGYLPKDVMAQDGPVVQAAFAAGRYAMWPTGTWSLMGFEDSRKENKDFNYDYFIPGVANSKLQYPQIAGGIGGGFSIAARAKDKDSCALWIDYLMSPDAQKIWTEVFFQIAPTPFDASTVKLPDIPKKAMELMSKGPEMGYNISVVIPSNVVEIYWNGLGGILSGQLTPKDWASKVQAEWEIAKKEGRVLKP